MKLKDDPNWNEYVETLQELIDWAIQKRFEDFTEEIEWALPARGIHMTHDKIKSRAWFGKQKCVGWGEGQACDMANRYIREELT